MRQGVEPRTRSPSLVELGTTFMNDPDGDRVRHTGVEVIVRALLQEAEFLYRVELG